MEFLTNLSLVGYLDLNKNELRNARVQNLGTAPSSPVAGQIYFDSGSNKFYVYNGSGWVDFYVSTTTLNNITAPTGSVSLNSQKITNLATPTSTNDAATKSYVDTALTGLSWKQAVRVATTANGTLATAFENGDTVDGVTLATGDRILLKNQSSASENGIYTVNASGAPTRATDADTGAELVGAAVYVTEGTTNSDTAWTCTTNATISLGSTSLTFAQFAGGTSYSAGNAIQISGNTINALYDSTTISVNGSNQLQVTSGYFSRKYTGTITGDSSTTAFTITHSLGTKDVVVSIRGTSSPYTDTLVQADISTTSTSAVSVSFATAPASGVNFSVTVLG